MRKLIAAALLALSLAACSASTTDTGAGSTDAPAVTEAEAPEAPPAKDAKSLVTKELGKGNRKGVERVNVNAAGGRITVKWAIDENLTEGLTKDEARLEATKILKAIRESDDFAKLKSARLTGTYSLVDQLGNESEDTVVRATYSKSLIGQINFDNFDFKKVFDIADDAFVHPAFVY